MRGDLRFAARARTAALLASALAACSAGTNTTQSPPTTLTYEIEFPSTAAAVSVETLQTFVFSTSTSGTDCPSLLVARESQSQLPTSLAQTNPVPLCNVLSGKAGQVPDVAYGPVSVLVVGQRGGADYMSGCTLASLSSTSGPVPVQLQLDNATALPDTTCTTVTQFCATPPQCTVGGDAGP
jgi:hypothetical protein